MSEMFPIIDLFAGPGGLGEGFSAYSTGATESRPFKIAVSVEMDAWAHQTLQLRSFFRQFPSGQAPEDYYQYVRGKIKRDQLFMNYPRQAESACREALHATLGSDDNVLIQQRIREELQKSGGNDWVLIGGPPCQAYSTMGRSRMRSADPDKFDKDPRHFLYRQYLSILAEFRPSVFVMENVRGILSSRVDDELIFPRILNDLRHPLQALSLEGEPLSYRIYSLVVFKDNPETLLPGEFLIQSENYGIPQARHRVILLGVREDLTTKPEVLSRLPAVNAESVLDDLPPVRSSLTKRLDISGEDWAKEIRECEKEEWFQSGALAGKASSNLMLDIVCDRMRQSLSRLKTDVSTGAEYISGEYAPVYNSDWYSDFRLGGICNHSARPHMASDLHRYMFAACYAKVMSSSPRMRDYPDELLPKHRSVRQIVRAGVSGEMFEDRFRVQMAGRPAATITAHIAKDGHYSIHHDPLQCRSLTVREAARLQTFPDNYFFEGPRTQQYRQVGNAVPPYLAYQIAKVVYGILGK